jgi:AcrR family transcriptional regulator
MNKPIAEPETKKNPRKYGGLSEAERVIDRRERFLEAGLSIFGTVGLRGATVRALCKSAGLTERYFYESFTDTEELFCSVYEKQSSLLRDFFILELPKLPSDLNLRVEAALDLYFSAMRDERVVRILYLESMVGSPRVTNMHHTATRQYADLGAHFIRADNPELDLSQEFLANVSIAINGICFTLAAQWMLGGYSTAQDIIVKSCALVIRGTIRELRNESLSKP